jgi:cellulose synthase/poly-beta-1,6-N-acetylglucosamine synthase-like glycosyltransferase
MHNPVMITAPVSYYQEQSLFERMQTLEFFTLVATGAAFIGNNRASTCNGANFAYRKDVFNEVGGFKGIDDLASGDDELLLQKVAAIYPGRIGFLKLRDAIVLTHAKPTLKEFLQQRRRWASKSVKYKDKRVVALVVGLWLFYTSVALNFFIGFYNPIFFAISFSEMGLMALLEFILLLPVTRFFRRSSLLWLIPMSMPLYITYFAYIGLIGNKGKYIWKGRLVK